MRDICSPRKQQRTRGNISHSLKRTAPPHPTSPEPSRGPGRCKRHLEQKTCHTLEKPHRASGSSCSNQRASPHTSRNLLGSWRPDAAAPQCGLTRKRLDPRPLRQTSPLQPAYSVSTLARALRWPSTGPAPLMPTKDSLTRKRKVKHRRWATLLRFCTAPSCWIRDTSISGQSAPQDRRLAHLPPGSTRRIHSPCRTRAQDKTRQKLHSAHTPSPQLHTHTQAILSYLFRKPDRPAKMPPRPSCRRARSYDPSTTTTPSHPARKERHIDFFAPASPRDKLSPLAPTFGPRKGIVPSGTVARRRRVQRCGAGDARSRVCEDGEAKPQCVRKGVPVGIFVEGDGERRVLWGNGGEESNFGSGIGIGLGLGFGPRDSEEAVEEGVV